MIPFLLVMTSYDVKWHHLIRHSIFTVLDLTIFQKVKKYWKLQCNRKIQLKCLWNVQVHEFLQFDEEIWNKTDFWSDLHGIWWLPRQRQKRWKNNWHMKISAENEGTVTEIFNPLLKTPYGVGRRRHPNPPCQTSRSSPKIEPLSVPLHDLKLYRMKYWKSRYFLNVKSR